MLASVTFCDTAIGFTSWHNENYKFIGDLEDGQLGENDINWMNYEETLTAWEVTVLYLRHHGIKFSGIYHQKGRYGVPYFDNGKKLCLDIQSWGYLMEEALNMKPDTDLPGCKWSYWAEPNEFVLPYEEPPDDIFHWKHDPIAKTKMELYLKSGPSST